jgi:DNA polymerase III delta prime subunit
MDTFINKYKPYYLAEFKMEKHIRIMLKTLFELDDLNILFIGNSGSGKSILLNAIIRDYYSLSKTDTIPDANVLFINNLKEQGINYYRNDMKTFCQSNSTIKGKKKMIVIDDLDNINEQSQQVFRNYIDKYKHNIHFISVCSNIQKIIESIQSRVYIMKLQPPTELEIIDIMNMIIENENIQICEEAKNYLIKQVNGSIRVLIHYLEKFYIYGNYVDYETSREMCSTISIQKFEEYIQYLKDNNIGQAIKVLYSIYDQGYSVIDILDYLFTFIKSTDNLTEDIKYRIIPFLCKYITIFNNIHEDVVELAFFTNNIYTIFQE